MIDAMIRLVALRPYLDALEIQEPPWGRGQVACPPLVPMLYRC